MKWRSVQYRLEAVLAWLALAILRSLGPVQASNFGGALARTIGPLLPVNKVGDANLQLALPELDAKARRRILRDAWDNLGRTIAELPHVGSLRRTASGPGWEIDGEADIVAIAKAGGPAILVSGHLGNWELLPAMAAYFGIRMSSFYRAASNPIVNRMLIGLRSQALPPDTPNFPKGSTGARAALLHLNRGGYLGMLVDQKMNDGIPAPFFGRTAMTAPAAATFALRFRCPVIPAHIERLGPARLRVVVEPPMELPNTGNRQADVATLTTAINQRLEGWIRARPGEWLWLHRRWPKQKTFTYVK